MAQIRKANGLVIFFSRVNMFERSCLNLSQATQNKTNIGLRSKSGCNRQKDRQMEWRFRQADRETGEVAGWLLRSQTDIQTDDRHRTYIFHQAYMGTEKVAGWLVCRQTVR